MKFVIIIPARYRSSRFPGKPLVQICGKSLVRRVWDRCVEALPEQEVYVATDDERIAAHCTKQGIRTLITSSTCLTGTDRVYEAAQQVEADVYINVQGDEPMIMPSDILAVMDAARDSPGSVVNAMCPIAIESDFYSPFVPKVVSRPDGRLLYMSRAAIPSTKSHGFVTANKQVCIYGFTKQALAAFYAHGRKTALEEIEDIEILRFLELGFEVKMIPVSGASLAVDIPEDVVRVEAAINAAV
jgi:3-deoxy-manno-octulosonate cytidylyltransferase (CMP-KDO synthetase)